MPDWWSVGIIIYQLMCDDTPFVFEDSSLTPDEYKAKNDELICTQAVEFKSYRSRKFSENLKDLVLKLLNRDPTTRLGATNDSAEILSHPVFDPSFINDVNTKQMKV